MKNALKNTLIILLTTLTDFTVNSLTALGITYFGAETSDSISLIIGIVTGLIFGYTASRWVKGNFWFVYFLIYPWVRNYWAGVQGFLVFSYLGYGSTVDGLKTLLLQYIIPGDLFRSFLTNPWHSIPFALAPVVGALAYRYQNEE